MGRVGKKRSGEELEGEQPSAKRRKLEDGTEVEEEEESSELPLVPMDMTESSEPTEGGEASVASEADKIPEAEGRSDADLQTVPIPVESELVPAPIIPPFEPSIELGELSKTKRRSSTAHTSPAKIPQDLPPITEAEKLKQIQKEKRAFLQCKSVENVPVESWQGGQAVRKGKFTREEDKTLVDAADRYLKEKGFTVDEGREKLCSGKYDKDMRKAWLEIARALPGRSIESVYYRGKRVLMKKKTGAWEKDEVEELLRHVDTIGPKWSKIAEKLGRFESSVRDKYREVSAQRRGGKSGPWTDEEIDNLKRLVEASRVGDDIPWSAISKSLGTRTRSQCRKKWNDSISATKSMRKWEVTDDIDLVQRVYVSGASHNSEINWKDISEGLSWTASQCKKRWMQLSKYTGVDILDFDERLEVIQQILADTAAEQESEDDDSLLNASAGSTSGADRSSLELSGLVPMGSPSVGGGSPGVVVGGGGDGGSASGEGGSLGTPGGSGDNSPMRKSKRVTRVKVKDVRKEQQRRRSSAPGSDVSSMSSDLGGSSSGGSGNNGGPSGSSGVDDAVPPIPSSLGEGGAGEGAGEAISGDYDESLVIDDAELQTLAEAAPPSEEELRELAEAGGASAVEGA